MTPDLSDMVINVGNMDEAWYREQYLDVQKVGIRPALHYQLYGRWMNRHISPEAADGDREAIERLIGTLNRPKTISYCIPIMNRPDDIRETLAFNLAENREFSEHIEFVVLFFDLDYETHNWVKDSFPEELSSGYLRVVVSDELKFWHFSRAKNAFRGKIRGRIYSSLDGDNFVVAGETRQLLEIAQQHDDSFVFHHFSGNWGDGSSGRVSVPRPLYEAVGYDNRMMPRQYDEIDMMISTLVKYPAASLLRYDSSNHFLSSKLASKFVGEIGIFPRKTELISAVDRKAPANPRGDAYVQDNPDWQAMQSFNQMSCYWKNSRPGAEKSRYLGEAVKARHAVIDLFPRQKLLPAIVSAWRDDREVPEIGADEVCLFTCVKNDDTFLPYFYEHYSQLGITHFFIVDDGSDNPVRDQLPYDNVHVYRPEAGSFATGKGMWLEALMKYYLPEGAWALVVDADEFLDLPAGDSDIRAYCRTLEAQGYEYTPALLLDMVPSEVPDLSAAGDNDRLFVTAFADHIFVQDEPSAAFLGHSSIKWGFGPYARTAWAFDTRYHAYDTFDSLRKIPLMRYRPKMHINQGFHELHFTDKTPAPGTAIWGRDRIMVLRHYKLAKLLLQTGHSNLGEYHPRTAENIAKIFGSSPEDSLNTLLQLPRMRYSPETFKAALDSTRR